jgi:hypothetical protein
MARGTIAPIDKGTTLIDRFGRKGGVCFSLSILASSDVSENCVAIADAT